MTLTPMDVTEKIPLRTDEQGIVRVGQTRVTLDLIIESYKEGFNAEEIVQQYPSLELGDIYYVIGYYLRHSEAVESYLTKGAIEHLKVRSQNEVRFARPGIRERLLARKKQKTINPE